MAIDRLMIKGPGTSPALERRHDTIPSQAAPAISTLLSFWRRHSEQSGVPSRVIMEPFGLFPWLGHLSIYEAVEGGRDFRNRLEGTAIVAITGEDWTGRMASAVDARFGSSLVPSMRNAIASGQAAIHTMKVYQDGYKDITRLLLPVRARQDGPIDQVFLVIYADPPKEPA